MITTGIIVGVIIALVFAVISVAANESAKRQARKIIESGRVLDVKQAESVLKVMGNKTINHTRETDELYDGLKKLIEVVNVRN